MYWEKGVGPTALQCLFERLRDQGVSLVGLASAVANDRAMRAYEKAGLLPYRDFCENGEVYRYFTIDLTLTAQQGAPADAKTRAAERSRCPKRRNFRSGSGTVFGLTLDRNRLSWHQRFWWLPLRGGRKVSVRPNADSRPVERGHRPCIVAQPGFSLMLWFCRR
jgi:hypothetical protein